MILITISSTFFSCCYFTGGSATPPAFFRTTGGRLMEHQLNKRSGLRPRGWGVEKKTCPWQRISWIFMDFHCYSLISWIFNDPLLFIDFHWFSIIFNGFHPCFFSAGGRTAYGAPTQQKKWLASAGFGERKHESLILIIFHWFLKVFIDFHWFSLIFIDFHVFPIDIKWFILPGGPCLRKANAP